MKKKYRISTNTLETWEKIKFGVNIEIDVFSQIFNANVLINKLDSTKILNLVILNILRQQVFFLIWNLDTLISCYQNFHHFKIFKNKIFKQVKKSIK